MSTSPPNHIQPQTRNLNRTIGLVLAAAGTLDATYLSWLHLAHSRPVLCTEGGGCDIVQNSVYSEIGGFPIALLGLAGYILILAMLLFDKKIGDWGPPVVLGTTLIGTLYSAYLTYLELFVLHAICPYCVASAIFMMGLLAVAVYRFGASWQESPG